MPAPHASTSPELRKRAARMVFEIRQQNGQAPGAIAWVADQLGIHREALRGWGRNSMVVTKEGAGLADRLELTVEFDGAGAVAVAEHPAVHVSAEFAHLGALVVGRELGRLVGVVEGPV